VERILNEYNPFEKHLKDLEISDLFALKSVSEGWYVEYKSEVPKAVSIAKSISAFANTYGGWLFYGISEKSKEEAVAGSFCGIARSDMDGCLQMIRQAVANSVNPSPHFDIKVLWGPLKSIGIAKDHGIICVRVPQGYASPYVHKSGLIYRRVGDGSEPKPENDRFILDQLWRRGDEIRADYKNWLERSLEFSKAEEGMPYLRIFLTPDLWRDKGVWADLDTKRVRDILAQPNDDTTIFSTPFDTVYSTNGGFVGRQLSGNNPHNLTATFYLSRNLTSTLVLPLPFISGAHRFVLEDELDGYKHALRYVDSLEQHGHEEPNIIDLNFIFSAMVGLFHIQSRLDKEANRTGPLYIKSQLMNVWRGRPFLDVEQVISYQSTHGIPVCMNREIYAPPGKDPDSFHFIPQLDSLDDPKIGKFWQAMQAFEPLASAMGIETGLNDAFGTNEERKYIYPDLIAASLRASEAQRLRNERRKANSIL
jgi:Putative DNA-binding domain